MEIHLLAGRPIFFPFLSGMLDYQCSSCDARCCKGASVGIGRSRELAALLHVQPALALFAGELFPSGALPVIDTVLEQCWFLDSSQRCRLEKAAGREHKPTGCRLFPFNQFRAADEWIVVMPHFLCPLQVLDEPEQSARSNHDEVSREIHFAGIPRDGHPMLTPPPNARWTAIMPLERNVRDMGAAHLRSVEYAPYGDVQADLTAKTLGTPRGARCGSLRARIASFLGYGEGRPTEKVVRELVVLTPYLRMRLTTTPREVLPQMITAISVLAGVVQHMPGTIMTARTLVQLMERRAPMLLALARLLDRPRLSDGYTGEALVRKAAGIAPHVGEALLAIEENARAARAETLGTILQNLPAFRTPLTPEASGALMNLGRYLSEAVDYF